MPKIKVGQVKATLPPDLDALSVRTNAGDFIKGVENSDTGGEFLPTAYKDSNEQTTVGWGSRADDLSPGDTITKDDAQARLNNGLDASVNAIHRHGGETVWKLLDQDTKDAVLSVMHNVGDSGVIFDRKSGDYTNFWKAFLSGDKERMAQELDWGKDSGHQKRRDTEKAKILKSSKKQPEMEMASPPAMVDGAN